MDEELASGPAIAENNLEVAAEAPKVEAESAPATPEAREPERDKVQERFDKLTREKYEALRAADTARYENERLAERLKALETKPDPVVPDDLPVQADDDFDGSKYRAALAAYFKAEARKEVESTLNARDQQTKQAEQKSAFEKRQQEFIASKPDYADKVLRNDSLPITPTMAASIRESDMGPQVAYYLAENVDKALLISQMPGTAQIRELGRIEARLEAAKAPPPAPVSKAPPPPPSIEGSEPAIRITPDHPDSDSLDVNDWLRRRNKQVNSRK